MLKGKVTTPPHLVGHPSFSWKAFVKPSVRICTSSLRLELNLELPGVPLHGKSAGGKEVGKPFCYIPFVSSATLWERGAPQRSPSPHFEKAVSPCSRYVNHMKNFSIFQNMDKLYLLPFPEFAGFHNPLTSKRLLYPHQYIIPNTPASTLSLDEDICGEGCPCLSPSSAVDEEGLFFSVKEELQKKSRRPLRQVWVSPFVKMQAANKALKKSYSVNTISLKAEGRHIQLQNHPLSKSKRDPGRVSRPFTAIGLCRRASQNASCQQTSSKTSSSQTKQQDKETASELLTNTDFLTVCGSSLTRGSGATSPERIPRNPHLPTEWRSKAAFFFRTRSRAAKEPLPLLVGSPTRLFSSPAPRPPQRFHTTCSQTVRPVVNMVVNAHLQ
ncbi:uncharacterized protein C12orf42 homolog [Psammomys obesus]|uniref:uncharacterized protein C12orf42 homolog n=1 Tax=Psammomys obesus TaxID=48139 RepID=UPI002452DD8A|nr:uncharacterized protein C12orf42 homolog [Psammomys obesus]